MRKKICFILTAITMLCCSTSCNLLKKEEKVNVLQKVVVNDFENSADMAKLLIGNKLGKVQIQKNADYVKSGNSSAKVSVVGNPSFGAPYMYQTFKLEGNEEYSDFSKNVKMTLWVYNDDVVEHNLQAEYKFDSGSLGKTEVSLGSKEWTLLTYEVDRQYLPMNSEGEYSSCVGVYFYFDISQNSESYDLYFDELSLYRTDKGFNKSVMYLDEHEICSFDHAYQHSLLSTTDDYLDLAGKLSISQDYAQKEKDFNLKVDAPAGSTPFQNGGGWPGIEVNQTILKLFDFSLYDDTDEFCFDVYSPKENGLDYLWVTFRDGFEREIYKGTENALTKGEWQTIRISVAEINANVARKEFGFVSTSRIMVRWGEFVGNDRVAYFDNFRMELK